MLLMRTSPSVVLCRQDHRTTRRLPRSQIIRPFVLLPISTSLSLLNWFNPLPSSLPPVTISPLASSFCPPSRQGIRPSLLLFFSRNRRHPLRQYLLYERIRRENRWAERVHLLGTIFLQTKATPTSIELSFVRVMHLLTLPDELFVMEIFPYLHSADLIRAFGTLGNTRLLSLIYASIRHLDLPDKINNIDALRHHQWKQIRSLRVHADHLHEVIYFLSALFTLWPLRVLKGHDAEAQERNLIARFDKETEGEKIREN